MSKMDNLRAMREARYEKAQALARSGQPSPMQAVRPPAVAPVAPVAAPRAEASTVVSPGAGEELCGHRNMSGRTCTRERGHAAKSHRYS